MNKKLRYLPVLLALLLGTLSMRADYPPFQNEKLSYIISYKWGLIDKNAATATLSLINRTNSYEVMLTAQTLPWADKIFSVRDTLQSWISRKTMKPIKYIKTTHENGRYVKDVLTYSYNGSKVTGTCNRLKIAKGKRKKSVFTATVNSPAYDMISIFYYIRSLDFQAITTRPMKVNILSGSSPEVLTIRNLGLETTSLPSGKSYRCYHIQFTFTSGKGKNVSAPMDTWVTADAQHIPVKLVGTLPIGKVRAFLTGAS